MELYLPEIKQVLEEYSKVFTVKDLRSIFNKNYLKWKLPISTQFKQFHEFIIERKELLILISLPRGNRYILNNPGNLPSVFEVASNLYNDSYLSHYSAVSYHGLTKEIIKSVYSNRPRPFTSNHSDFNISQNDIDNAFSSLPKTTSQYFDYQNYRVYLLNSKNGDFGIIKDGDIRVTSIERTLVDIAVRPQYSGGVYEVLDIYRNAEGKFSVNKLLMCLKRYEYIYPYHQTIGFYLEMAGYEEKIFRMFSQSPMQYDFYLTYNIENPVYNDHWKIYHPRNLGN